MVLALGLTGKKTPTSWKTFILKDQSWNDGYSCLYRTSILYKILFLGISIPLAANYREVQGTVIPCPKGILR